MLLNRLETFLLSNHYKREIKKSNVYGILTKLLHKMKPLFVFEEFKLSPTLQCLPSWSHEMHSVVSISKPVRRLCCKDEPLRITWVFLLLTIKLSKEHIISAIFIIFSITGRYNIKCVRRETSTLTKWCNHCNS